MLFGYSFKHYISRTYNLYIKVGSNAVDIKRPVPYIIVKIFKDVQTNVEVFSILRRSSIVVEQDHLAEVIER